MTHLGNLGSTSKPPFLKNSARPNEFDQWARTFAKEKDADAENMLHKREQERLKS